LRTPGFARSFAHNTLLLTGDPGPDATLQWVEQALAGVDHRHITAYCALTEPTLHALGATGYQVQAEILMTRPVSAGPLRSPAGVEVVTLPADDPVLERLHTRFWQDEWGPDLDAATVHDLVDRRAVMDRAGSVTSLVVLTGGEAAASIDVCVRDDIAELDALSTLPEHRGRGLGAALFARGVEVARQAGAELVLLTVLADDWPRQWYSRLGFDELGPATEAALGPAPASYAASPGSDSTGE
jgi:GNAT superfamily N-acetyltransferase